MKWVLWFRQVYKQLFSALCRIDTCTLYSRFEQFFWTIERRIESYSCRRAQRYIYCKWSLVFVSKVAVVIRHLSIHRVYPVRKRWRSIQTWPIANNTLRYCEFLYLDYCMNNNCCRYWKQCWAKLNRSYCLNKSFVFDFFTSTMNCWHRPIRNRFVL